MPASKPIIIGLTGGIGSGKSEAARYLGALGAVHVDADAISRRLTAPGGEALGEIRARFGDDVFQMDGALDRAALAARVFSDEGERRALEAILHPRVQRDMLAAVDQAAGNGGKVVLLDVPLLFETGMDAMCDEVWVMRADPETQIMRVMQRDGLDRAEAQARIDAQMPEDMREARATRVISSDRPVEKTRAELMQHFQHALKRFTEEG